MTSCGSLPLEDERDDEDDDDEDKGSDLLLDNLRLWSNNGSFSLFHSGINCQIEVVERKSCGSEDGQNGNNRFSEFETMVFSVTLLMI